jgi:hypothetical protein
MHTSHNNYSVVRIGRLFGEHVNSLLRHFFLTKHVIIIKPNCPWGLDLQSWQISRSYRYPRVTQSRRRRMDGLEYIAVWDEERCRWEGDGAEPTRAMDRTRRKSRASNFKVPEANHDLKIDIVRSKHGWGGTKEDVSDKGRRRRC